MRTSASPTMFEMGETPKRCPKCDQVSSRVVSCWVTTGGRQRTRRCVCGCQWVTVTPMSRDAVLTAPGLGREFV
jgi:hypothetical protein